MARTYRTADGVPLVDGLKVWDNNARVVVVRLAGSWEENGELWFDTETVDGARSHLMSESRVATRHPFTGRVAE